MYCEKCGKLNPEGAMFCSNCSSILRSRRSTAPAAKPAEPSLSENDATRRIPVTNTATHPAEPFKPTLSEREEVFSAPKNTYPTRRTPAIPEQPRRRHYYEDDAANPSETVKFCSAWCNALSVVSWIIFIALLAVGIGGGAMLILLGISQNESMMYFGGTALMILFVIIAVAYHAKNMVQIKILKKFNEIKK